MACDAQLEGTQIGRANVRKAVEMSGGISGGLSEGNSGKMSGFRYKIISTCSSYDFVPPWLTHIHTHGNTHTDSF